MNSATIAAMAGGGQYNRHSRLQLANLQSALPLWEHAAAAVGQDSAGLVTIADYGASQGRNSMGPMGRAIDLVRERDADRPVQVVHTDLPSNDFASLFTLLADDPASYLRGRGEVHPLAVGRSYFDAVLPAGSVDLGWSSNALHWMSHSPVEVDDHAWATFSACAQARSAVDAVLADDWLRFLRARSRELRPGGRVVCQFMGRGEEQQGFEWMADHFWQAILALRAAGQLTEAETRRMTAPSAGRSPEQIAAPFAAGLVPELALDHVSRFVSPDPFWDEYRETGDAARLGARWAAMMRAANGPNFAAALDSGLDPGRDRDALLDALTQELAWRVAADPQRSVSWNVLVSIRKRG
jgi:SAM-dependent methyltransferase